jgi:hypothetical protein
MSRASGAQRNNFLGCKQKEGFDTVREELKGVCHEVKTAGQATRIEYAEIREHMGKLEAKGEAIEHKQ